MKKHYDKFCKIYKKKVRIYEDYIYFKYYYKIKPCDIYNIYYIYIYKSFINYYNTTKLYSNQYSIMFLLYIIFVWNKGAKL